MARDLGKLPTIDFNHVDVSSLSREITICKNKQNDTGDAFQLLTNSVSTPSTQISTLVSSLTSGMPKSVNVTANSLLPLQQLITADVATTTAAKFVPTRLTISSGRCRSSHSSTSPPITPLQSVETTTHYVSATGQHWYKHPVTQYNQRPDKRQLVRGRIIGGACRHLWELYSF